MASYRREMKDQHHQHEEDKQSIGNSEISRQNRKESVYSRVIQRDFIKQESQRCHKGSSGNCDADRESRTSYNIYRQPSKPDEESPKFIVVKNPPLEPSTMVVAHSDQHQQSRSRR